MRRNLLRKDFYDKIKIHKENFFLFLLASAIEYRHSDM
jgi:hypothetical protein